jgi:lipopolysaccharide export system protein LptA
MIGRLKMWNGTVAAFALGLALAGPAAAQLAQNSDAPVDITADQLEVVNAECLATYKGAAEALQDTVRLRADVLKIYYKTQASSPAPKAGGAPKSQCGGELDRMEASGSVFYVTPQQRVRGDTALYQAGSDTITISGDVVAAQGQNVMRGTKLIITVSTGDAQMQGESTGRAKGNRVRTVVFPSQKSAGPAAAPR